MLPAVILSPANGCERNVMSVLNGSSMLVTGGTGSFGKAFVRFALDTLHPERIAVFSRDELKQYEMKSVFADDSRIRWFLGDIRDKDRLHRALKGVDYVIHAAALKQVDTAEYNPFEFVKTNVLGSQNVIDACIDEGVKKVIALSTDKASSPINLYGASKLTADKLFVAANNYAQDGATAMSVVRYGNVMGSRGSVVPFFRARVRDGEPLPITNPEMTRFWITLNEAVKFVVDSFDDMTGGELYVPRIPSMRLLDLAEAIAPNHPIVEIGIRPGEKMHEEMIGADDSHRTRRMSDRYVVMPTISEWAAPATRGEPVDIGFSYRSDTNDQWLSAAQLREILNLA